jgi:hypothetical protein
MSEPTAAEIQALQTVIDSATAAAVAAAVAPLQAQLDARETDSAVETAVAAAVAPLQTEIDGLATRAAAAEARTAELEAEATAAEAARVEAEEAAATAAALAEVRAARAAVLAGSIEEGGLGWDAERVEARADFYAGLDEDAWLGQVEDLRAQASVTSKIDPPTPPAPLAGASVVGGSPKPPAQAKAEGSDNLNTVLANRGRIGTLAL